jgi:osmoprotectant transport system permease protein
MDVFVNALRWLTDPANWSGDDGIAMRAAEHVWVTLVSLTIACVIALPVALWLGHVGKGGTVAINISNVGRAVPTLVILALLFLTPMRLTIWPTIIALVLFAIPPIMTNAYVGMREVDRDAVESARGMGMSAMQVLRKVELPLAVPLIMNGIRLAAVQVVATATIAAFVAGPGLGRIISRGFGVQDRAMMVAGAILVAALALVVEGVMEWLQRRVEPIRKIRRAAARPALVAIAVTEA